MLKGIISFIFLSSLIFGGTNTQITVFPSQTDTPSYVYQEFDRMSVFKGIMTIKSLPIGIVPESIDVMDPVYERLSLRDDFGDTGSFYRNLAGKTVYFETDQGDRKETTFIKKEGDDIYVRQGSQIVVNPKGRLFVPVNERYVIEPELDIEVSSRYKAYKEATMTYYNRLLTSSMQYELNIYDDSDSAVFLTYLLLHNQSNKHFNAHVTLSSKSPKFTSPRPISSAVYSSRESLSEVAYQPSEIYEEALKKQYSIPIGDSKLPVSQSSLTVGKSEIALLFTHSQQELSSVRQLTLVNTTGKPWLPGNLHVLMNDELTYINPIPFISVDDSFSLTLAPVREVYGVKNTSKGFNELSNETTEYNVTITVYNNSSEAQNVYILDKLPPQATLGGSYSQFLTDSHEFEDTVSVQANGMTKVTYSYTR